MIPLKEVTVNSLLWSRVSDSHLIPLLTCIGGALGIDVIITSSEQGPVSFILARKPYKGHRAKESRSLRLGRTQAET